MMVCLETGNLHERLNDIQYLPDARVSEVCMSASDALQRLSRRQMLRGMAAGLSLTLLPSFPALRLVNAAIPLTPPVVPPILHSDDEIGALMLTRIMLQRAGGRVVSLKDARQTLEYCRTQPVSLVLSDIMKPGMDGLEMLRQLKADSRTAAIPFVFLSARGDEQTIAYAFELGADAFLTKPILHWDVVGEIRRVLARYGVEYPPLRLHTLRRPVVVVDGDPQSRSTIISRLGTWNVVCVPAADVFEALSVGQSQPVSALVINKGPEGLVTLEAIRRARLLRHPGPVPRPWPGRTTGGLRPAASAPRSSRSPWDSRIPFVDGDVLYP
jgi:CheY-like chemotaxis protein